MRDAFYASPLFPRLLNPEAIKETIARGVSNGQLAYVGKTAGGKYLPFNFERTITADIEISEEMFIVSKETAEAYRARAAQPATPPPVQPSIPGIEAIGGSNSQPTSLNSGSGAGEPTVPSGAKWISRTDSVAAGIA